MPTHQWLQREFSYGYDSGEILRLRPDRTRFREEQRIGGSYRRVFRRAVRPYLSPDATVLELGPGKGSWSRAILKHIPEGRLITLDFQDVTPWLRPEQYGGRLECHTVGDNSFASVADGSIDFFWSMGVLCHNNLDCIANIMANALPKLKPGGMACHQYGDWQKLDRFGWRRGAVPPEFQTLEDNEIWWPRNAKQSMATICQDAGWTVVKADLGLLRRDGLILCRRETHC